MDPTRLRAVSSKGGSAAHREAKRGFALMDDERRREVSRKGLEARRIRLPAEDAAADAFGPADELDAAGLEPGA